MNDTAPGGSSAFAGRTYVVTGGGSGIGRAIALALGAADARVVVAGRTPRKLEETAALVEPDGRVPDAGRRAVARQARCTGGLRPPPCNAYPAEPPPPRS
ncbi:SDR family NAD(P)-dependent oxidoreductase [Streptomyces altiplanensis]